MDGTHIKINQFGYTDGEDWDDGAGGRVKHICIFYGDAVFSIQTLYQREGTVVTSRRHGGNQKSFEMIMGEDGSKHIKINQSGYTDGEDWDDGAGGRVKHICIFYGDAVFSIQTLYQREGTVVTSRRHGGNQKSFEMINLNDEPLTWVSGYYGTVPSLYSYNSVKGITSLKFGTKNASYGPFGKEVGEAFLFKTGTEISGFHGRSSSANLHAIGVYIHCPATRFLDEPLLSDVKNISTSRPKRNKPS